jgi:hypothetical protein
LDQNQSQNPSLDLGLATNLNNHQKQVQHQGRSPKWDKKLANSKQNLSQNRNYDKKSKVQN